MLRRVLARYVLTSLMLATVAGVSHAQVREEARLLLATQVVEELRSQRDQAIPERLLERAYGIAVFPDVNKAAFVVGGRYGQGALVVRNENGVFSNPVFVRLAGGSVGWQIGVQQTDVVLVFTTKAGIERITKGKMTLGADASVAAGPVGRQASAGTDGSFKAEVYSYSRSRGLFAGLALDGSALTIDAKANRSFYRTRDVTAQQILDGAVQTDAATVPRFLAAINSSTAPRATASAEQAPAAPATADGSSSPQPAPAPTNQVKTFPMEDPQPGSEPGTQPSSEPGSPPPPRD
jgi:lipid-binding SYLF domain-containing protein